MTNTNAKGFIPATVVIVISSILFMIMAVVAEAGNPYTENLDKVVTSYDKECGSASVELTVPDNIEDNPGSSEWLYRLQIEVEGEIVGSTDLIKGPGTSTFNVNFDEDQNNGSVMVRYYFLDATEWDIVEPNLVIDSEIGDAYTEFEVLTNCEEPELIVVDEDPVATDATCDKSGSITFPEFEGIKWAVAGEHYEAGTFSFESGDYVVDAVASGDVPPAKVYSWNITIVEATDCKIATPTPTPVSNQETLPETGARDYVGQIVLGAVALLVIGFGLIRLRRYWMEC